MEEKLLKLAKDLAEFMLIQVFGERCNEVFEGCECCKRWAAFDILMENPFDE